jgi:hypothetical protein
VDVGEEVGGIAAEGLQRCDDADDGMGVTGVVVASNADRQAFGDDVQFVTGNSTAAPPIPDRFAFDSGHPNPFNARPSIQFDLPTPSRVNLEIFDVVGRLVKTLVNGSLGVGRHLVDWDGLDDRGAPVAAGVYYCRMVAGEFEDQGRVTLVK